MTDAFITTGAYAYGRLFTTKQAAEMLQLAPSTLARWRSSSSGPCYVRIESRVRYREVDLRVYIDAGVEHPTYENYFRYHALPARSLNGHAAQGQQNAKLN